MLMGNILAYSVYEVLFAVVKVKVKGKVPRHEEWRYSSTLS